MLFQACREIFCAIKSRNIQKIKGKIQMEKIRNWMDCLTESQCKVISVYVMKYQCDNLREAARETGFSIDTVNKYTKRAINRIYTRNSNILYKKC